MFYHNGGTGCAEPARPEPSFITVTKHRVRSADLPRRRMLFYRHLHDLVARGLSHSALWLRPEANLRRKFLWHPSRIPTLMHPCMSQVQVAANTTSEISGSATLRAASSLFSLTRSCIPRYPRQTHTPSNSIQYTIIINPDSGV